MQLPTSKANSDPSVVVSLLTDKSSHEVLVTLTPPSVPVDKRAPLDICCVIDVSGSMEAEALLPGNPAEGGKTESTGLSVLDIVKHSIRTIIATMQPGDQMALVAFDDSARTIASLTKTTNDGKKHLLDQIDKLFPGGSTNLWDGLKEGMKLLQHGTNKAPIRSDEFSGRISKLFILTDGMPNIVPPRGHIPMLKTYLESNPSLQSVSISTFGFGYYLDSPLLLEIAQVGGGGYSFIPDSGMVGTVFVHAVSNAYATFAHRAKLDLEIPDGVSVEVKGDINLSKTSWGAQIDAGDLQFGQTRDYVITFSKFDSKIAFTLTYRPFTSQEDVKSDTLILGGSKMENSARIAYHRSRLEFVEILFTTNSAGLPEVTKRLESLSKSISAIVDYPDAVALDKDVSGEGILALQKQNYERWGRHYLPSLALSHQRQQCGNFKDPGLQAYGSASKIFIAEREKLDAAFDELPPPKPSLPSRGDTYRTPLNSMSAYYSSVGPCFSGHCRVETSEGLTVRVDELKRGVAIRTLKGPKTIAAVIRTAIPLGEAELSVIGGLEVTAWHPILRDGGWVFPASISSPHVKSCNAVYSVLLNQDETDHQDGHSICVEGIWCVTLGHGILTGSDVRAHSFLGDYSQVLASLVHLPGFYQSDGIIRCAGTLRSRISGEICGFIAQDDVTVGMRSPSVGITCI